ncbi:hypothetical protein BH10ACT11_BH10ACT11_01440 [soil metagenome]
MAEFEVRAARVDEIPTVISMYEWLFAPPGEKPADWDERRAAVALEQAIESRDSAILVAGDDAGGLIGLCTAYQDMHSVRFGYRVWVEDLAVDPQWRSRRVGKALLDAAKAWAAERGAMHLELDSSLSRTDAHRFSEREGSQYKAFSFGWRL